MFLGVSLSTNNRSNVVINPESTEATKLKSWYDSEGKETSMSAIGSGMNFSANNGSRSMYSDRVCLSHITSNPSLGEEKVLKTLLHIKIWEKEELVNMYCSLYFSVLELT
ncbi:Replication protein A 70 kDa DNA-binding subunit B [Cardamine amara subsp. amara]|uniref:Replication protein A 70 kDa DNA-binding subunit B n=1 Tax=Cardamine amara subsp. amara TaxID=228776 RepID=A0ABD0ZQZ6_CARAN